MLAGYEQRQRRVDVAAPISEAVAIPFDVVHHTHLFRPDGAVDRGGGREKLADSRVPF